MMRMLWSGYFSAAIVAMMSGFAAAPAWSQSVALITDLAGRVSGSGSVTILSEVPADARMQLDAGARLVALYLKSGDEYTIIGPAQVQFRADEPLVTGGAKPQKKLSPLRKDGNVTIKPVGVTQAAFVMRSSRPTARIRLLTLSGTRVLEVSPEFRWQSTEPDAKYRFELTDEAGRSLYEAEVQGSSLKLPGSVTLKEGAGYTWEISARTADNRRFVSAGDFSIANAELRAQAQVLRPASGAPVSERVTYAAWLDQVELRDEARRYWRALAAERPNDSRLKALAAE